ncbi:Bax inhibitor-1/YccA family protein [Pseudomonas putida]|uniref:Bax inhibitor-1/YccA family protein n=1 Tax=Pseudomonas putida TaxID=303 RepID=A0A8I1JIR9_PSEPU|nr:Bax inhibitor-1/YccA family protein [Pseudomonas putida]MBI6882834.1 Bax inhibitor-1/YccA family protein [Pseudomonas putida]
MNHQLGASETGSVLEKPGVSDSSRVLKNTYMLLAATLLFSAVTALISMSYRLPLPHGLLMLVVFYALLFLIHKTQNSSWGIIFTFALTGLLGASLGPILNQVLHMSNGTAIIAQSLIMTGVTFVGLSLWVAKTRKDMDFLQGFLLVGFFVLLTGVLVSFFIQATFLSLAISAGFVLFASASILFQTSQIVRGGETNYVMATISLYVSIYNLFVSILSLTGYFSRDD